MNNRSVSLPDLVCEKRRNTALSLSEGFAGARHSGALAATAQNFAPRPGAGAPPGSWAGQEVPSNIGQVLPMYYRTRQLVLGTEKSGQRVPHKLLTDLRMLEKSLAYEIRLLHPQLFQRFDDLQLDRLLRSMSFLRLSQGRWVFGAESLNAAWPPTPHMRVFMLLSGLVALFPDPIGAGQRMEIRRGAIFGEEQFRICDESFYDIMGASAVCEEPSIVGVLSTEGLEAAFADRAFGNRRIAQMVKHVPALAQVVHTAPTTTKAPEPQDQRKSVVPSDEEKESNAVATALRDLGKVSATLHVAQGVEVMSSEPLDDCVLIVSRGALEVRADVTLSEKLDALPPRKVRLRVLVDRAENLAQDSIFDKLDPYCVVKLGDLKRFQTPVMWNVGANPKFEYNGVLKYKDESTLEFTVMDRDQFSADDLCGSASIAISELHDGYSGHLLLTRPRRGVFANDEELEEPAGKIFFKIHWDTEKFSALNRTAKERTWNDQVVFTIKEQDCWGHEQLMLGPLFKRTLEQASSFLTYQVSLHNFRVVGAESRHGKDMVVCWKVSRGRFAEFIRHCGREKQFLHACKFSTLEKQTTVKELAKRLLEKWEVEEQCTMMRSGIYEVKETEETMEPSRFRVAYRGVKAHITIRCGLNLTGGSWFDKLDPYAVVRFKGSKQEIRTSVLQDAGSDPVWECEGVLVYNGETAMELAVWDYDRFKSDALVGTGQLPVEQFCSGFEGMIPLSPPGDKKKKSLKQSMIVLGIQWDMPRDPNSTFTTNLSNMLRPAG